MIWAVRRPFSVAREIFAWCPTSPQLVGDAGEQLGPAEHRDHVEDAGRGRLAGERRAQWLRDLAELEAGRFRREP